MFKMMTRAVAVVSMLALLSPVAVFAVDGGAGTPDLASETAVVAPVSVTQAGDSVEAPSLVEMFLGFLYSVAGGTAAAAPPENAGTTPDPQMRGPLIDPVGHHAN